MARNKAAVKKFIVTLSDEERGALCLAQTNSRTGVRHHQSGARIPSILAPRARQGARRVEPRDHGLEYEEDVRPQPRLTRPCAAWRRESRRLPVNRGRSQRDLDATKRPAEADRRKIVLGVPLQNLSPTGLYEEGQVKPERLVRAAYCGTPAFILASMA